MTSTHMYQGLEADSKPSSRVLKPPGGGSSCIFGGSDEAASSSRPHRMASNIFGSNAEPDNVPKKSNPPGGKTSGIFQKPAAGQVAAKHNPPGGQTYDIFGDSQAPTIFKQAHPNKPKDNISLPGAEVLVAIKPVKAERPPPPPPAPTPEPTPEVKIPVIKEEKKVVMPEVDMSKHEPHLGPRPRSHNRVLNPPGGKSSITFY